MSLPHILLGFLREPASGYDLKRAFERSVAHFWSAELSQIYPTLKRMESKGWLASQVEPSDRGPDRRVYRVTEEGRAELRSWLASGPDMGVDRFAYLGQIFFMDELDDPEATLSFMRTLRGQLAQRLAVLEATEEMFAECVPGYPDAMSARGVHQYVTLRMGLHALRAKVAWCDETIQRLEV